MLQKIPFPKYLELDYVSKSQLDDVRHSIRRWQWNKKFQQPPTDAMIVGSATHTATLEPDEFDKRYVAIPTDINRRSNAGKAEYEAFLAEAGDRIPLKADVIADVLAMAHVVRSHPLVKPLFELPHVVEGTGVRKDGWMGYNFGVKVRPDLYIPDAETVLDLKTTQSINRWSLIRSIRDFRYHVQAALYMDVMNSIGCPVNDFVFLFVEKVAPNDVYLVRLNKESLALGRIEYMEDMDRIQDHLDSGGEAWAGPLGGNEIQEVSIV